MPNRTFRTGLSVVGVVQARQPIAAEVDANATADADAILPVDVSGGAVTVTPPVGPQAGTWFAVVDSRGNAGTNAISVDFTGANYHGSAGGTVTVSANRASGVFAYVSAAVGWVKVQ